uniref:Si:dkey-283b1.7 n=1 Tax=Neogobius melanostomus TaxID=47308 RepID=A0A8C6S5I8_9GOBI
PAKLVPLLSLLAASPRLQAEYSSKNEDYEFGDYRGKWCLDDHGFVYALGEVYYPSPSACPCTCTADGPVCVRPRCPRVHPGARASGTRAAVPCVTECLAPHCDSPVPQVSRCERCRCAANREVYCTISDCPAPHCVNPTYEPHHCCPICRTGETQHPQQTHSPLFIPLKVLQTNRAPHPPLVGRQTLPLHTREKCLSVAREVLQAS